MSWDEYDARTLRTKLRERAPLIATAVLLVGVFGGFVALIAQNTGDGDNKAEVLSANQTRSTTTVVPSDEQVAPDLNEHPEATDGDKQAAIEGATNFVIAWARPALPQPEWFAGIKPFTSPDTVESFASVDPRNVPSTAVTGKAQIEAIGPLSASVIVPTNGGNMRVVLDSDWKASYIEPVSQPGAARQ